MVLDFGSESFLPVVCRAVVCGAVPCRAVPLFAVPCRALSWQSNCARTLSLEEREIINDGGDTVSRHQNTTSPCCLSSSFCICDCDDEAATTISLSIFLPPGHGGWYVVQYYR